MIQETTVPVLGAGEIALRLFCALAIGIIIGLERESVHRPAGLRTHMLVALGACAVMITGQLLHNEYLPLGTHADPARLSAQVIAGVGFLGAGTIIRDGASVKGLTTAASVWSVACLGTAVGAGYYYIGLFGTTSMLITLIAFEWIQKRLTKSRDDIFRYSVNCGDIQIGLEEIYALADKMGAELSDIRSAKTQDSLFDVSFTISFTGLKSKQQGRAFFIELSQNLHVFQITQHTLRT